MSHQTGTTIHCVVIYPFLGIQDPSHRLFLKLIELCRQSGCPCPVVVYNRLRKMSAAASNVLNDLAAQGKIDIKFSYGSDTCDDWLEGFGHVIDFKLVPPESKNRVVLLPGDLTQAADESALFAELEKFIRYDGEAELLIGDFDSVNPLSSKEIIDLYGIAPLVANWFPGAWEAIRRLEIKKVRSEFLNLSMSELRRQLGRRVFAHEQTLNALVTRWQACWTESGEKELPANHQWERVVGRMYLGAIADDATGRNYSGAIDQIERAERVLRAIWKDIQQWSPKLPPHEFRRLAELYDRLDERSTKIRDAARIAIWAQMGF